MPPAPRSLKPMATPSRGEHSSTARLATTSTRLRKGSATWTLPLFSERVLVEIGRGEGRAAHPAPVGRLAHQDEVVGLFPRLRRAHGCARSDPRAPARRPPRSPGSCRRSRHRRPRRHRGWARPARCRTWRCPPSTSRAISSERSPLLALRDLPKRSGSRTAMTSAPMQ